MAYPKGGRADKYGNRFEYNWAIFELLDVIEEKILSVTLEAVGEDEKGVDLWIKNKDGSMEGQQCKGRNRSKENWTFYEASQLNIFTNWKKHLDYSETNRVSLVSPISFTLLEDLTTASRNINMDEPDFFVDEQVFGKNTGKETKSLFISICKVLEIDYTSLSGKVKAQRYFSRMYYRQVPDGTLKDLILRRIDLLFATDKEEVYSKFLKLLFIEDILGKPLDIVFINSYIEAEGIEYLDLTRDDRILPAINKLNHEYRRSFIPLFGGLIQRTSFERCKRILESGESIIIHGNAGNGKSGCTENIIDYCINNKVPFLSIKLDRHVPEYNSRKWGEILGLPASITHCINAISENRPAVLILDQLDALRWTQAHTGDALSICAEIIDEVKNINSRRNLPIMIVFVCRTYDLENDRSIVSLFQNEDDDNFKWNKVMIDTLDQNAVSKIVGDQYQDLSMKQRSLLSVPSNLFIWEQLEDKNGCLEIDTTYGLIHKWWDQILLRARKHSIDTAKLVDIKDQIIGFIDKHGRLFTPASAISASTEYLEFLKSNSFITDENRKITFVHQSISDCFLSDIMFKRYFEGYSIIQIFGEKDKQTPSKRYQAQLFLQQLAEYDIGEFLTTGNAILETDGIRYNMKYVFLEVMAQLSRKDKLIFEFIIRKMEDPEWKKHFLNSVVRWRKRYVRYFREEKVFEKWMKNTDEQEIVIQLMASIAPDYNEDDIRFIKEYALNEDDRWHVCFLRNIHEGSDEYFDLRLQFYKQYPNYMLRNIDIKDMMEICEVRTIRLVALMMELLVRGSEQRLYKYSEDFIDDKDFSVTDYLAVFKYLLPFLPNKDEVNVEYSNWSLYHGNHKSLERACTNIIKMALRQCAIDDADLLITMLEPFLGCGNDYYNELILDSFRYLSSDRSDYVIEYLITDFNRTGFERTSGNKDSLLSLKEVIKKHSVYCSDVVYAQLEDKIIHFVPSNAKDELQHRMDFNREKNGCHAYWAFWGDFQYETIACLPEQRKSLFILELYKSLIRRRGNNHSIYVYEWSSFHGVNSPVAGKQLSAKNWNQIINNPEITFNRKRVGRHVDGYFISSNLIEFADSFQRYVQNNPQGALELLLKNNSDINPIYIDRAWGGLSRSDMINEVSNTQIEVFIKKYGYNLSDFRARDICECIEKKEDIVWSEDIHKCLIDIVTNHKSPENDSPIFYSKDDNNSNTAEMLLNNAFNCVKGSAARAMGNLLWHRKELFGKYKESIAKIANDDNPVTRFSSLWALWPSYNISREWAVENIYQVMKNDYRTIIFHDSREIFCRTYDVKKEVIRQIIEESLCTEDKEVLQVCGYCIAELFMLHDDFGDYIEKYNELHDEVKVHVLEMIITYFSVPKYHDKAKAHLIHFAQVEHEKADEVKWGRLFRDNLLDIEEDRDLLEAVASSRIGKRMLESFLEYLDLNRARKKYATLILNICERIIDSEGIDNDYEWGLETILVKTIIGLYNEVKGIPFSEEKEIASLCLDMWDLMYKRDFGSAKQLTNQFMDM